VLAIAPLTPEVIETGSSPDEPPLALEPGAATALDAPDAARATRTPPGRAGR